MDGPAMASNAQTLQLSPATPNYEDLLRATTAISGCRDIQTFRECFATELQRFISFDYVLVNILDDSGAVRWRMFHTPNLDKEVTLPEFRAGETPTLWVYNEQQPIIINDWEQEQRYPRLREYFKQYDIRSSCVLPLTTVHRRLGVLAIGVSRPNAYSAKDIQFLALVADHLALSIDSALNLESSHEVQAELKRKNEQLELVLDLTNRVVSNLEIRDLLREVAGSVRRVMKCDAAAVALPEPKGDRFRFYALDFPDSKGFLTEETLMPMDSPIGIAFHTAKVELPASRRSRSIVPKLVRTQP